MGHSMQRINREDYSDLYSSDLTTSLSPHSNEKFQYWIKRISDAVEESCQAPCPWEDWSRHFDNILKEILLDILQYHRIDTSKTVMTLCVSGSLAKRQATPYSDIDGFLLLQNEADVKIVEVAMQAMANLCQRIFSLTHQFCPDPVGITPFRYIGTPAQLIQKIENGDVFDPDLFVRAMMGSRIILGSYKLFERLHALIQTSKRCHSLVEDCYKTTVDEFKGPTDKMAIDIKRDLLRPLDFILLALRAKHQLTTLDGQYLEFNTIVKHLDVVRVIGEDVLGADARRGHVREAAIDAAIGRDECQFRRAERWHEVRADYHRRQRRPRPDGERIIRAGEVQGGIGIGAVGLPGNVHLVGAAVLTVTLPLTVPSPSSVALGATVRLPLIVS